MSLFTTALAILLAVTTFLTLIKLGFNTLNAFLLTLEIRWVLLIILDEQVEEKSRNKR